MGSMANDLSVWKSRCQGYKNYIKDQRQKSNFTDLGNHGFMLIKSPFPWSCPHCWQWCWHVLVWGWECPGQVTDSPVLWCWHCHHPPGPAPACAHPPWCWWWPDLWPHSSRTPAPQPRPDLPDTVSVSQLSHGQPRHWSRHCQIYFNF